MKVPRSLTGSSRKTKAIELHAFADASNLACSAVAIAVVNHSSGKIKGLLKRSGPLVSEEIVVARNAWVRRVQRGVNPKLQAPGWGIIEDKATKVLKRKGRVTGYDPNYLDGILFVES